MTPIPFPPKMEILKSWRCEHLGDEPDKHRWRAGWDKYRLPNGEQRVCGIILTPFPVIKLTDQGAWICTTSYMEHNREWVISDSLNSRKWVSDDGFSAFVKRTQREALESIAARLYRWNTNCERDLMLSKSAIGVCRELLPEYAHHVEGL